MTRTHIAIRSSDSHDDSATTAAFPLPALPTVTLMGVTVHAITERQCVTRILNALERGRGGWVVTPNLDILRRWVRDASFAELAEQADLAVADGMPLMWASRVQGTSLPERIAGSTLISTLSAAVAEAGRSVYLLGGDPGTAEVAGQVLQSRSPGLRVAGTYCPPFGFERDPAQLEAIRSRLIDARPDIVFVALGSPKQEHVIAVLREALPSAWWLGVGISFSFLAGRVQRAPRWVQRIGLEWLHRLCQEPRRLARRYLVDGVPFAFRLLVDAGRSRLGGSSRSRGASQARAGGTAPAAEADRRADDGG